MEPIIPFEPVRRDEVPTTGEWVAQIKWDGVRILTYADGQSARLFNRKQHERSRQFPELLDVSAYTTARSLILDGEVIALGTNGLPSFHQVMRRDGVRRLERVPSLQQTVPITYMVFDLLYLDGEWVTELPFIERMALLEETVIATNFVQTVDTQQNAMPLLNVTKEYTMEGIVLKQPNSPYEIGAKRDWWVKVKHYRDVICVVGGYTKNDSDRVNALLLGLYDGESLVYVGHAGTGRLSHTEWQEITVVLEKIRAATNPFRDMPRRRTTASSPPVYVQPILTVKIQFAEWTEGHTMRQPSIQAFVNSNPTDCVFDV